MASATGLSDLTVTGSTGRLGGMVARQLAAAGSYASRGPYRAPDWQVEAWLSTYTAIAAGQLSGVSPDVHELTGQDPLSLAQLLAKPRL